MPVLKELDLNATCEDYCVTILERRRNHGKGYPDSGIGYSNTCTHFDGRPYVTIPQEVMDKFEEKMKIVSSQKERFAPNLFKILEKTHFENLLPYHEGSYTTLLPRKEATDIFIAYAEEFHRLEQSNQDILLKLEDLQEHIHNNIDISNRNFTTNFEELKRDYYKTHHILENYKRHIDELFVGYDGLQDHIVDCNNRNEKRYEYLEQIISKLNQDIKDIEVHAIKQTNHLETKLKNQISSSNTRFYIIIIILYIIHYILSMKYVVYDTVQYPMLPGL